MSTLSEHKIHTLSEAIEIRKAWKNDHQKVVFTNGCFDILHPGHIDYLEKARALGDMLFVAVNDDERSSTGMKFRFAKSSNCSRPT